MPNATINSAVIQIGAGILRTAPLGTVEPTTLSAVYGAGWIELGATAEGSEFSYELDTDTVTVAESNDPLKIVTTGRSIGIAFALAEITAVNLQKVCNGGTIVTGTAAAPLTYVTFEPPALGAEVRIMLAWDSEDAQERWIFRQCFQAGNVSIARRKGVDLATLPAEFQLEKPTSGAAPFKTYLANARAGNSFTVNP